MKSAGDDSFIDTGGFRDSFFEVVFKEDIEPEPIREVKVAKAKPRRSFFAFIPCIPTKKVNK